jgi:RHS repeat-associated protein
VQKGGGPVPAPDRLGSIGRYLPYGEERTGQSGNPANGNEKFAAYTRDGVTGLDYADQRWYAQGQGRFLTSDPYQASAGPGDPASWNRYAYVQGDPANYVDHSGLATCWVVGVQDLGGWFAQVQCRTALGELFTESMIGAQRFYGNPANNDDWKRNGEEYTRTIGAELDRAEVARQLYIPFYAIVEKAFQLPECSEFFAGADVISWRQAWENWSISFRPPNLSLLGGLPRDAETEGGERSLVDTLLGRPYRTANTRIHPEVWKSASEFERALLVLHELGHAIAFMSRGSFNAGGFIHRDNTPAANSYNDQGITEKCLNPLGLGR